MGFGAGPARISRSGYNARLLRVESGAPAVDNRVTSRSAEAAVWEKVEMVAEMITVDEVGTQLGVGSMCVGPSECCQLA
jgi:hypothetical protein